MAPRQKSTVADGRDRETAEDPGPQSTPTADPAVSKTAMNSARATPTRRSTRLAKPETPAVAPGDTTLTGGGNGPTIRLRPDKLSLGITPGAFGAPGSPGSTTTVSDGDLFKQESDENANGVQNVLKGLARMERKLQRITKRQRLKVEESVGTITAVKRSLDQERVDSIASRDPSPGARGRQDQLSIKAEASSAEAPRFPAENGPRESQDDDLTDKELGDTSCLWKRNGPLGQPVEKPAPPSHDRGAARAPPVESDYLPLPWKGRLGYACLNTYLRSGKTPVFSSRTCRMASIIDHRYPLSDPTQPEHPTRNRPDKSKTPDKARGLKFVQDLGLANVRDIVKMLRWNERYGIRFMRLSSEMFPFASHAEHGYKLASFASEALAEAGTVAAEFGHRLTTHPGQFTQLGSPRQEVIDAAVRDLEYHNEMLTLLKLPEQQDRDAVMILHLGGIYGDKAATLDRFRHNYTTRLSDSIKRRLVLENDDVSWSVHDLLPLCEELNIPMVLDFHHHNILFDADQCREGSADLVPLIPRIRSTWERKRITMKMHYSEPCAGAVTPRDRRKHSPRVASMPPCPPDVDLMIEAKDKEQAVFELMRNFRLPGHERVRFMIPNKRVDEPEPEESSVRAELVAKKKKAAKGGRRKNGGGGGGVEDKVSAEVDKKEDEESDDGTKDTGSKRPQIPDSEIGMGGPEGRVYWPPGMEEWLRPLKRDQKRKFDVYEGYQDGELDDTS